MSACASILEQLSAGADVTNPEVEAHLGACAPCRAAAETLASIDDAIAAAGGELPAVPSFATIASPARAAAYKQRRRRALRRAAPFAAASLLAAGVACVALWTLTSLQRGPAEAPVGTWLEAGTGGRDVLLPCGAHAHLDGGRMRFTSRAGVQERLELRGGSVALAVPHLPNGHTLAVVTQDAAVLVHGTRFRVYQDERGTSVRVTQGLVEVRPAGEGRKPIFLRPGQSTLVEPLDAYRQGLRAAALAALERGQLTHARENLSALLATQPAPLSAGEALALTAWAEAAGGDEQRARTSYEQALQLLPKGAHPLWADNASAELALLLEHHDHQAASMAWSSYLQRFPQGLHAGRARVRLADLQRRR